MRIQRDGGKEPALREALLSMEGKDPLEATKLLKVTDISEDSTHLLSTYLFQTLLTPSMLTTTPQGVSYYYPQEHRIMDTRLAPKCPHVSEQNQYDYQGSFFWKTWVLKYGRGRMWINWKGRLWAFQVEAQKIGRLLGRLSCRATGNLFWDSVLSCVQTAYWTRSLVPLGK